MRCIREFTLSISAPMRHVFWGIAPHVRRKCAGKGRPRFTAITLPMRSVLSTAKGFMLSSGGTFTGTMIIFRNCEGFIRTMPLLMYDEHNPEDLDTGMEDHIADETRYFCMARPIKPKRPAEQKTLLNDPLNQAADLGNYNDFRRI